VIDCSSARSSSGVVATVARSTSVRATEVQGIPSKVQQSGSEPVARNGALAASEDASHAAAMRGESVADRQDGCVDAVQAPDRNAVSDRFLAHADRAQLTPTYHAVLLRRQLRKADVGMVAVQRFPS
jgi:hypothetical protein